jgi:Rrf2 family transcriptional regulator, iron-sulfur cluster assembly transcription factor
MNLISRRSLLSIVAVVDIASQPESTRTSAKSISSRQDLPAAHLATLLQGLVHANILKSVRGPDGGYELARGRDQISAGEIVRAALALNDNDSVDTSSRSKLLGFIVEPSVKKAEELFFANLDAISVGQLCEEAESAKLAG